MTQVTCFDSDVVIYSADTDNPLGPPVAQLFQSAGDAPAGVGSLILLTEVLTKPLRTDPHGKVTMQLRDTLARIDLYPLDAEAAALSLTLAISYGLKAADATHLATGIVAGADRFLTNNRTDFPKSIREIDIVYPDDL